LLRTSFLARFRIRFGGETAPLSVRKGHAQHEARQLHDSLRPTRSRQMGTKMSDRQLGRYPQLPSRPVLPEGECQIWWANRLEAREWHVALLDAAERRRRDRFVHDADRDRFTLGCALLRMVLGAVLGVAPREVALDRSCPDCDLPHGRPTPRHAADVDCSVSHSGDQVVVAVTRGTRVGIDVELIEPLTALDRLVTQVLAVAEAASWRCTPDADRLRSFYTYWTRKEAVLKAAGCGLRVSPIELTVSAPGEPARLLAAGQIPLSTERVCLYDLRAPAGYAASVATIDGSATTVVEFDAGDVLSTNPDNSSLGAT